MLDFEQNYTSLLREEKDKKRAEGIKGSALKTIDFDDRKQRLCDRENLVKDQYLI